MTRSQFSSEDIRSRIRKTFETKNIFVAQLAQWLHSIPQVCSSNAVISKKIQEHIYCQLLKRRHKEKETGNCPFWNLFLVRRKFQFWHQQRRHQRHFRQRFWRRIFPPKFFELRPICADSGVRSDPAGGRRQSLAEDLRTGIAFSRNRRRPDQKILHYIFNVWLFASLLHNYLQNKIKTFVPLNKRRIEIQTFVSLFLTFQLFVIFVQFTERMLKHGPSPASF